MISKNLEINPKNENAKLKAEVYKSNTYPRFIYQNNIQFHQDAP